jgi:hypothetical protein
MVTPFFAKVNESVVTIAQRSKVEETSRRQGFCKIVFNTHRNLSSGLMQLVSRMLMLFWK